MPNGHHACLPNAIIVTLWASVVIRLVVVILPQNADVLTIRPKAVREKRNIEAMQLANQTTGGSTGESAGQTEKTQRTIMQ